jgi:hypothetical protein
LGSKNAICRPVGGSAAETDELFDGLNRALDKTMDWVNGKRLAQT